MKIEYQGSTYEYDPADLSVGECEEIEKFCGTRGLGEWSGQLQVANTRALRALWWTVRRQAGEDPGPVARPDPGFRPLAFSRAYAAAERAEEEAEAAAAAAAGEAEADPTQAPGSPASAGTTTTPAGQLAATLSLPG